MAMSATIYFHIFYIFDDTRPAHCMGERCNSLLGQFIINVYNAMKLLQEQLPPVYEGFLGLVYKSNSSKLLQEALYILDEPTMCFSILCCLQSLTARM